jgi:hypothetical protein
MFWLQGREISMKRVAIYVRVSTSRQETANQRSELEAVADRSGWKIVKVFEDAGISGAKGRDQRPGLDAMMKAVNAKEFEMVAAWSVDRLGRSLTDLLAILQALQEKDVDLFLRQQGLLQQYLPEPDVEPGRPARDFTSEPPRNSLCCAPIGERVPSETRHGGQHDPHIRTA